jgi:hypothetical protein
VFPPRPTSGAPAYLVCRLYKTDHAKQTSDGLFSDFGKVQTFDGDAFKTKVEAEARGIEVAKAWIDRRSSVAHNAKPA